MTENDDLYVIKCPIPLTPECSYSRFDTDTSIKSGRVNLVLPLLFCLIKKGLFSRRIKKKTKTKRKG